MKLEQQHSSGRFISHYSGNEIIIDETSYQHNLLIIPGQEIINWQVDFSHLSIENFNDIFEIQPELILLGTGHSLIYPDQGLIAEIHALHIGLEIMDTPSACRSYNFLLGENRHFVDCIDSGELINSLNTELQGKNLPFAEFALTALWPPVESA